MSLEQLLALQEVDTEIDRLMEQRSGLPALAAFKEAHESLARLEAEIGEVSARKRELDLAEDKAEGEMKLDEEKLGREEKRLFAGGLSARDAGHLRDEVEMLRGRIGQREDEALALLEQQQEHEQELAALAARRDAVAAEKERLESEIATEWAKIDAEVARLKDRRSAAAAEVEEGLLELYEEIRPAKEGTAAVPLENRMCGGCHLRLSAAEESAVRKENPPRCIHCRRILVPT